MNSKKRIIAILTLILLSMLVVPIIAINTVNPDSGMLVTLLLFFVVYPIVSVCVGIISGKEIKHFWFTPILTAGLFWVFSSVTYNALFPFVYSIIYFALCSFSMLIMWLVSREK